MSIGVLAANRRRAGAAPPPPALSLPAPGGSNLLAYSQRFDDPAWGKYQCSIEADARIAPDGSGGADRHLFQWDPGLAYQAPSYAGEVTMSVFAKAESGSELYLAEFGGVWAKFNLADGSVTGTSGGVTSFSGYYGGGWWRCGMTWTAGNAATLYFGSSTGGTRLLWQAQLLSGAYPDGGPLAVRDA